jgi:hypothetical protein
MKLILVFLIFITVFINPTNFFIKVLNTFDLKVMRNLYSRKLMRIASMNLTVKSLREELKLEVVMVKIQVETG